MLSCESGTSTSGLELARFALALVLVRARVLPCVREVGLVILLEMRVAIFGGEGFE